MCSYVVISPIRDTKGNDTVNLIATPCFPDSPLPATTRLEQPIKTKLCLRLFEDSSDSSSSSVSYLSEWTTDSSSNDWTTDSEAESEESEIPFMWSATP
jgi:hypothetical protein